MFQMFKSSQLVTLINVVVEHATGLCKDAQCVM